MSLSRQVLVSLLGIGIAAAVCGHRPAQAQDATKDAQEAAQDAANDGAFQKRLFADAAGKSKAYACFVRVYDADHLAQHPLQKVSAMKLLVTYEKNADNPDGNTSFRLGLRYRTRAGNFDSSGDCHRAQIMNGKGDPRIECSVDCDGGGVELGLTADNKSAMARVERMRIWRDGKPDEEAEYALEGGADDRVFRLDRSNLNECASLVTERKELAALRSVANRKQ